MKTLANIVTNLFELAGMLFLLAVVSGVLLDADIIGPVLDYINNNILICVGLGVVYIMYKSESDL